MPNYNEFCKSKNCPQYIEWECYGHNVSCKLVGQSHNIEQVPNDCEFKEEINEIENEN